MRLIGALATLVVLAAGAAVGWRTGAIGRLVAPSITADASGGLAATIGDFSLDAPAGTFAAGQRLTLDGGAPATPSLGAGHLAGPPLSVSPAGRIAHPVLVTMSRSHSVDTARVLALVGSGRSASPLPVEIASGGRLRARVRDLSWVGFVVFASPTELTAWLVQHARSVVPSAPAACSSAGKRTLLESGSRSDSTVFQVAAIDGQPAGTVDFRICNRQSYAVEYSVTGAADAHGIVAGGAVTRISVVPKGLAGDALTVAGTFTARAAFWTVAFRLAEVLPGGDEIKDALRGGVSVAGWDTGGTLEAAGEGCREALAAVAQAADTANALLAAGTCLLNQASFQVVLQTWWAAAAQGIGFGPDNPASVAPVVTNAAALGTALRSLVAGWPPAAVPIQAEYVLGRMAFAEPHPSIKIDTIQKQQGGPNPYGYSIRYPRLVDAGARNDGFNAAVDGVLKDVIGSFLTDAGHASVSGGGPDLQPQLVCTTTEAYLDADIVSARIDCGAAFGGGQPATAPRTVTWDLRQGRQVQLADLFLPHAPYPAVLADDCNALYGQLNGTFRPPWQQRPPTDDDFSAWLLTPKGLELVFAKYAVGPGAAGEPQVIVPYSTLANFVQDGGPMAHTSDLTDALPHS